MGKTQYYEDSNKLHPEESNVQSFDPRQISTRVEEIIIERKYPFIGVIKISRINDKLAIPLVPIHALCKIVCLILQDIQYDNLRHPEKNPYKHCQTKIINIQDYAHVDVQNSIGNKISSDIE